MKKLILLIVLLSTACGVSSDQQSILDKSSCALPCWNGIIPGKTTEGEFVEILQNFSEIDTDSIQTQKRQGDIFDKFIFFSFRQPWTLGQHPRLRGEAYIIDNKVSNFIICGAINTSMKQLMEQIGEPENIISGNNIGSGRTVILIDSKSGLSYWFTTELDNLQITPDTALDCLNMFDTSHFEEMLNKGIFSAGYYNAEETRRVWYSWNGYGNLEEKYVPRQP